MSEREVIIFLKDREDEEIISESRYESKELYDGGWGWYVVAACFLCNMVTGGLAYSFGVIMEPMRADLGIGVGSISLVGGLFSGVTMLTGPLAAECVNRFGSRTTCIIGSVISSLAMFASSFCTSLISLLITYGILAGFGLGFVYVPSVVAVGEYFREKLSLATGICVCGSGAGTFVLAPTTALLIQHLGWRGCNRVMALFCLACTLFGLVMVPNKKKISKENSNNNNEPHPPTRKGKSDLICSIPFLLMILGNIPFAMSVYISYTYLPSMAVQSGLSSSDASFLISVVGISNSIGRVVSGWLADLRWTSPLGITIVTTVAACLFCSLLPSGLSWSLLVLTAVFGFSISSGPTVTTPLLVELLGIQHLNTAFGILTFARGLAALVGPSAAGFILESFSGDFFLPFYLGSALLGLSAFLHFIIWCLSRNSLVSRHGYIAM